MSDEEGGEEYGGSEYQVGSVCRLHLKNFMQYGECEMIPGPTLNVILGPNGSGKSSVVNGLALALGAKTNVLGRAENVIDFIRTGCDSAELEVELKGAKRNTVIGRRWDHGGRTIWTINGKRTTQKEVVSVVKAMNIQTDNLCQFLPQDKVHDFSKMNSKELLAKTVEAVARQELKDDHESLKALQKELHEKQERFKNKTNNLAQMKNQVQSLERDVKNFDEKNQIQATMQLIKKRKKWADVKESLTSLAHCKRVRDETQAKIARMEEELRPLADAINAKAEERQAIETEIKREDEASKRCESTVKDKRARFEAVREQAEGLENQILHAEEQLKERNDHIKNLEVEIARMKRECQQECDDELSKGLHEQFRALKEEASILSEHNQNLQADRTEKGYEKRDIENKITRARNERSQLTSVDNQKKEILVNLPQGRDTLKALRWLGDNEQNFRGKIYSPLMLQISVEDQNNAVYLENTIPLRDLVAFATESSEDMNSLLNEFRQNQNLSTNAFQVDRNGDAEQQFPTPQVTFPSQYGFVGYLSDMFTAPGPIKHYLCKQYKLHNIPVFEKKAERYLEQLVNNGLRLFFIGNQRFNCVKSRYSGKISTASSKVQERNMLKVSVDQVRLKVVEDELARLDNEHSKVSKEIRELNEAVKVAEKELETKRQEARAVQNRINYKQTLQTKVQLKERERTNFIEQNPGVDVDDVRRRVEAKRTKIAQDMVKINAELAKSAMDGVSHKMRVPVLKFKLMPVLDQVDILKRQMGEKEKCLEPEKITLGEHNETLRRIKDRYREVLTKARQESSGDEVGQWKGDSAPPELQQEFEKATFDGTKLSNATADQCKQFWQQEDNKLQMIDDVDKDKVDEYSKLRNDVADMEQDMERWEAEYAQKKEQMEEIRVRWIAQLTELIQAISQGFSGFFQTMGFAGEVKLGHGTDPNDFFSYGIEVLVKFRQNVELQKLDPFQQSGGERSVSTALYMLALQHLTKVPFRCVDEINQGMDAVNERRVFDMLIETSVRKNTAQYFLLTPKLLPDLNYDHGVTVLTVYNGDKMCDYPEWKNDEFLSQQEETFSQA